MGVLCGKFFKGSNKCGLLAEHFGRCVSEYTLNTWVMEETTIKGLIAERNVEIERLRGVIDKGAKAWLSLEPGIAWEGCLGDAMIAAVSEIRKLRCRLGSVVTENVDGVIAALHIEGGGDG